jgi:hypothetical protein
LTACGDKNGNTEPSGGVVHTVTVSPPTATIAKGGTFTFAASVDADAGVTDRTVTWSTGNASVATVDPATGVVTGVGAGTASITATSKADANVKGAASITVTDTSNTGTGAPATVTVSTINQTVCGFGGCNSVPATLSNVAGQLDVTLNVDPGSSKLIGVDLLLNCGGTDSVVATQTLASGNLVAEAAQAPITLSFNTAAFDSTTGAARVRNGTCTLKGRARTSTGTTTSTGQQITLANQDVIIGNLASTKQGLDAQGLLWHGGDVTITVTPVFYSAGRNAASTTISYEGKTQTLSNTNGTVTATFTDGNGANAGGATDIDQITDANSANTINVSVIDAGGQNLNQVASCFNGANVSLCSSQSVLAGAPTFIFPTATPFRLDTQKPAEGSFALANNSLQGTSANGYINGNFRFVADSAAGFVGPNAGSATGAGTTCPGATGGFNVVTCNYDFGGSDRVKVSFQYRVTGGSSSSWATLTSASTLSETQTVNGTGTSYQIRMITVDTLGNADTSKTVTPFGASDKFGVDLTAPSSFAANQTAGPTDHQQFTTVGGSNAAPFTTSGITDNLSGPAVDPLNGNVPVALVAQVRNWSGLTTSGKSGINGRIYSNTALAGAGNRTADQAVADNSPCLIGRFNTSASAAGPNAIQAFAADGTAIGYCTPVLYDVIGGAVPPAASTADGLGGYYTTEIITIDEAGNRAAPLTVTIVEDATAPSVAGVALPGSIAPNSSVAFSGSATDNVDLVGAYAVLNYSGTGMNLRYPTTSGPGTAFDNTLTRSATVTANVNNFIRSLAPATAGTPASSVTGNQPSTVQLNAVDEVGNVGGLAAPASLAATTFGTETATSWSSQFNAGFAVAASKTTISNCPAPTGSQTTGCGPAGKTTAANPTSTVLTATASGATATFSNPFSTVTFWYQNGLGEWVQFASTSAATVTDNGTNRMWAYSVTFDPGATGPDGMVLTPPDAGTIVLPVLAIGVNSSGDAVTTTPINLTLTNP